MAWSAPPTWTVGQVLTAANMNAYVRDNANYFKSSVGASVATSETTTSATFTDLTTVGPSVTLTTDTQVLVVLACFASNSGAFQASMSFRVDGASTVNAVDAQSISCPASGSGQNIAGAFFITGLTPGSSTFKARYRVTGGTGTFVTRQITVIPL